MVDLNLVNYIRQLLQMGYDINSIRTRLITSGYNTGLVDEAINYIYQPAVQQAAPRAGILGSLKNRKFLIILASVFVVTAVFLAVLMMSGGAQPIDMLVYLDSTTVVQGDALSFSKTFTNLEGTSMVSLKYDIIDQITGDTAAASQESFSTQSVSSQTSITIPESTPAGSYLLRAIAVYGEQKVEKTYPITVIEKASEAPPESETPEPAQPGEILPPGTASDNDNDGIPDDTDTDDDNDGLLDSEDSMPLDHDNDSTPDSSDTDSDNDGIIDKYDLYPYDRDNDGIPDVDDIDNDNDGIPDSEDLYPYDYDNDGVLDKDDDPTGRFYSFPSSQQSAATAPKCSNAIECNDYDVCTSDICSQGLCEHTVQSPCCGNFVCEGGETSGTCAQDCRQASVAADKTTLLIEQIMTAAESSPEKAAASCGEIEISLDADRCYTELAKKTSNNAFCEQVYSIDNKDRCFMFFVMSKDQFNLCERLAKRLLQNSCYSLKTMKSLEQ